MHLFLVAMHLLIASCGVGPLLPYSPHQGPHGIVPVGQIPDRQHIVLRSRDPTHKRSPNMSRPLSLRRVESTQPTTSGSSNSYAGRWSKLGVAAERQKNEDSVRVNEGSFFWTRKRLSLSCWIKTKSSYNTYMYVLARLKDNVFIAFMGVYAS